MNNDYPDFSVLISVYNKEKPTFLREALKSIANQTLMPKECILVQDGIISRELLNVIKSFKNEKFKLIEVKLDKNVGLGKALSAGTKLVTTDWIARMDSDDIAVSNRFKIQFDILKKNKDVAVVGGQIEEFYGDKKNIIGKRTVPRNYEDVNIFFKTRNPVNHPTAIINKKALMEVGGYESFEGFEDYYLWSKFIYRNYKIINVKETVLFMRANNGMYGRRGGFKYLLNFYKLKYGFFNSGLISFTQYLFGCLIMTLSVISPRYVRKWIYRIFLHKNSKNG
ncbi:glycosyltransferase [Paucilactobacillus kaifaensis]|uniref:glycosyltransferase n=1 Tax=Paucilactobacillus kaifaensis TaxID=2559921 RepID=UPI001485B423|nr:glycosyltransferase [Paucilactobacillus kaifaensis]